MVNIPGFTLEGSLRSKGSNVLFHAVRDADGLRGILKALLAASASPRERERYRREFELLQRLREYVKRTREQVLIGDASKPHPFSSDTYLERGGARSVLCLPLLRQEEFCGVLYLENNLATNAFTPGRLSLLRQVASQAAISIENARLYAEVQRGELALRRANDELEHRVEERTRELRQLQERLVDTAREVGMKVAAILKEHRADLVDFLTRDSRGSVLPEYLGELGDVLLREHDRLREGLDDVGQQIDHIRTILQVQQTYARTSLLVEECDLSQLIEDALSIQMAELQRHGVNVKRVLSPVPLVRADKHKVLQLLVSLIINARYALDAAPEGSRVLSVRIDRQDEWARIQVVDNGSGIAPEIREKLFTHGFTTRKEGHGFSLHASALAAQLMGGHLKLESEGPGKGATAILQIPLTRQQEA